MKKPPSSSEASKAEKRSISFPPELLKYAEDRAATDHAGYLSAYVQAAIEQERSRSATTTGSDLIIELAKQLTPTLAPLLEQNLTQKAEPSRVDQKRIIAVFLEALARALERGLDPTSRYELTGPEDSLKAMLRDPDLAATVTGMVFSAIARHANIPSDHSQEAGERIAPPPYPDATAPVRQAISAAKRSASSSRSKAS